MIDLKDISWETISDSDRAYIEDRMKEDPHWWDKPPLTPFSSADFSQALRCHEGNRMISRWVEDRARANTR